MSHDWHQRYRKGSWETLKYLRSANSEVQLQPPPPPTLLANSAVLSISFAWALRPIALQFSCSHQWRRRRLIFTFGAWRPTATSVVSTSQFLRSFAWELSPLLSSLVKVRSADAEDYHCQVRLFPQSRVFHPPKSSQTQIEVPLTQYCSFESMIDVWFFSSFTQKKPLWVESKSSERASYSGCLHYILRFRFRSIPRITKLIIPPTEAVYSIMMRSSRTIISAS